MSRLGKIVLDNNYVNPRIIIADVNGLPKALELVKNRDSSRHLNVNGEDIINLGYKGKKLDERSADLSRIISVNNLNLREIGCLTEEAYCKVLRCFVSYQASMGGNSNEYLSVRENVQGQLIKRMK